jgi:SH3 domain-containing YSC84-like protein 1
LADTEHPPPGDAAVATPITPTTPTTGKHDEKKKPAKPQKALLTIPSRVISKAIGLAIFTTARVGFQVSGATGSGIVIARLPDGSWSPPSGIQVHSVGAGFMIGVDIYDCVCVINSKDALAAFMNTRVSLGSDLAVVAGPYGAGGAVDFGKATAAEKPDGVDRHGKPVPQQAPYTSAPVGSVDSPASPAAAPGDGRLKADQKGHKRSSSSSALKPVFSYVKSRGFYAGISVDGTVVTERKEANATFYGEKINVDKILKGEVSAAAREKWISSGRVLIDALKFAETSKKGGEVASPAVGGQYPPQQQQFQQQFQQPHQNVPGVVGAPLERHENQAPIYGSAPGTHAATTGPPGTAVTPTGMRVGEEPLPPYVDDGRRHPGVGDSKTTYQ